MARRPTPAPAKAATPGLRHWLLAGLIILALTSIMPFLGYLL